MQRKLAKCMKIALAVLLISGSQVRILHGSPLSPKTENKKPRDIRLAAFVFFGISEQNRPPISP
ncbi:hypothetical protein [Celeribacter sp. HF31]|uniref:hypothetical protein n=1 Tax=Celeribacter sp. HF31 TaxID=2721558 RepID=UPI001430D38B|nr:hypothetical protein [Celeribacter sp. HF31]